MPSPPPPKGQSSLLLQRTPPAEEAVPKPCAKKACPTVGPAPLAGAAQPPASVGVADQTPLVGAREELLAAAAAAPPAMAVAAEPMTVAELPPPPKVAAPKAVVHPPPAPEVVADPPKASLLLAAAEAVTEQPPVQAEPPAVKAVVEPALAGVGGEEQLLAPRTVVSAGQIAAPLDSDSTRPKPEPQRPSCLRNLVCPSASSLQSSMKHDRPLRHLAGPLCLAPRELLQLAPSVCPLRPN